MWHRDWHFTLSSGGMIFGRSEPEPIFLSGVSGPLGPNRANMQTFQR